MSSMMECAMAVLLTTVTISAQPPAEKPQYKDITRPSVEDIERGVKLWTRRHSDRMKVEVRGRTAKGRPILLCRITDYTMPDDDKEHALVTNCHSGWEYNSVTANLRLIKWLSSDDAVAAEIRRKQVVLVTPVISPDGYSGDAQEGDPYIGAWDQSWGKNLPEADKNPEAVALKSIIDEYMPEVLCDVHGFNYEGQMMWEETGFSWASGLCRSYVSRVWELMDEEAEREGYFLFAAEESSGKIRASGPVPGADEHFYILGSTVNDMLYSYHWYHTIPVAFETGFEESAVVRIRGLLKIGNRRWRGEYYPGYPTRQVGCYVSQALVAYGTTAAERRASRVELWQKLRQLQIGGIHPEPVGQVMSFCATTPQGAEKYLKETALVKWVELLKGDPQFDYEALRAFVYATKAENLMPVSGAWPGGGAVGPEEATPIGHGLALRLLIPYPNPKITDIRLDGHKIAQSESDGYIVYHEPGTTVQVNIPPGKVRDFHAATCMYEPDGGRKQGFAPEDWEL